MSSPQEWTVLSERTLLSADGRFDVLAQDIRLPSGRVIKDYYRISGFDFAIVYALTRDGMALVEKGYRHGPRAVCLSLPVGHIDPGEKPLSAAKRELLEETGYANGEWTSLGSFSNNGNQGAGAVHMFIASGVEKVAKANSGDIEEMELELIPHSRTLELLREGVFKVVSSAALVAMAHALLPPPTPEA